MKTGLNLQTLLQKDTQHQKLNPLLKTIIINQKNALKSLIVIVIITITTSFSYSSPAMKFDPAGTWVYSAPDVTEGYTEGEMIIEEIEDGYSITVVFFGEYKVKADKVEYSKKSLVCTFNVEGELVTISGTFKKDEFKGTTSYSEGVFDFSAERKIEKIEE